MANDKTSGGNGPREGQVFRVFGYLETMDRRIVYGVVFLSLLIPVLLNVALEPAKMPTAQRAFDEVESLESRDDQIVFVAMDWSAATQAENKPQTEVILEHLLRNRIKFLVISDDYLSKPFTESLPRRIADKLEKDNPGQKWKYGKDWVNVGYKPGLSIMIQQLPKSEDMKELFKTDSDGRSLQDIPCMKNIKTLKDVPMLAEFTGSVGIFPMWIQFFQSKDHRPKFIHGCTSITIPEAYIYLDSKQIVGLLEGGAGAAYYSRLLGYTTTRPTQVMRNMTAVSLAHIMIIIFIVIGNVGMYMRKLGNQK